MADSNSQLNLLLVQISRSLLQYVGECWPWSSADEGALQTEIDDLVERQRVHVAALAETLVQRRLVIDFGTYPTEFTDLHFLALDYLLAQLVDNQTEVVDHITRAISLCSGDRSCVEMLQQIHAEEREILNELTKMAASRATPAA